MTENLKFAPSISFCRFAIAWLLWACCVYAAAQENAVQENAVQENAVQENAAQRITVQESNAGERNASGNVTASLESTPWYDAEKGEIIPVAVKPRQDDSVNRESRWLPKPKTITKKKDNTASTTSTTTGGGTSNGLFGSSLTVGNLFGWVLLAVIVMSIVGAVVYAISRAELSLPDKKGGSKDGKRADGLPDEQMLERIKHLPPELRRTDVNLRTECERLMNEGVFEQAIILLLGHQLLLLDRNGLLRLSRGKTNGKYVRETRASDEATAVWLRATADAFEQSYFGRHEIPADVFAELWRQNESLEAAAHSFGEAK